MADASDSQNAPAEEPQPQRDDVQEQPPAAEASQEAPAAPAAAAEEEEPAAPTEEDKPAEESTPEKRPAAFNENDAATPANQLVTAEEEPAAEEEEIDENGALVVADKMLSHVERVYRSSETRTPIVIAKSDGDPFFTVTTLARREGCAVWSIAMGAEKNEQNALDYVEVGTQNGDWVYLTNVEQASHDVLRKIALNLYTLKPEPKAFPRRHLFRLVLVTDKPIAVNDLIRPVLPQSMLQHCLVARAHVPAGVRAEGASPEKIQRRMPAEPPVFEQALSKHAQRREQGRDSDSESDADEPEKKATGMWFHRAVDFYETDGGSTVARVNEVIFDAVEAEDTKAIIELANSGRLNIDAVKRDGMNPLMFAVSRGRVESAKALIEAGADVHVRREVDNCPLLFMCIEAEELVHALIDAGANVDERFEGYRLEAHPSTMPNIAALIREVKNLPPVKTSALELAAAITV